MPALCLYPCSATTPPVTPSQFRDFCSAAAAGDLVVFVPRFRLSDSFSLLLAGAPS